MERVEVIMQARDRFETMEKVKQIIDFAIEQKITGELQVVVDADGNVSATFVAKDVGEAGE